MTARDFPVLPSEVEWVLAHGIGKLLIDRYRPHFGEEGAAFLAVGIMNSAFLMKPSGDGVRYGIENSALIEQQANSVYLDPKLEEAFSLLYSFMLIRIGPTNPELSRALSNRASELMISLRTTEEIFPTSDAAEFLEFVRAYALSLLSDKPVANPRS